LHIPQSLDAVDFDPVENYKTPYEPVLNKTVPMVDSPYFTTSMLTLKGEMAKDYSELDSFVLLFPVEGNFLLEWENGSIFVNTGEVVLIPNVIEKVNIKSQACKILEIYVNK
jgi:mannose-6-phosphate isomerase